VKRIAIILVLLMLSGCGRLANQLPTPTLYMIPTFPLIPSSSPSATATSTATNTALPTATLTATSSRVTPTPTPTDIPGFSRVFPFSSVGSAWKRFYPTDPLACAHDTQYSFWARQGASDNLLIFFGGGGGCWNAETCQRGSELYTAEVTTANSPQAQGGIFDLSNPENPFIDYDMVYIPVCTGDLHMGMYTRTYTGTDGSSVTIQHIGFLNASTVLTWVYAGVPNPTSVLVTGCSAGSAGSLVHAPYIMAHYPNVPVNQLGDSLGFVFQTYLDQETKQRTLENLADWIPSLATMTPDGLTLAQIYIAEANHYPQHRFAQINFNADQVQQGFYQALGGVSAQWFGDLNASLSAIHTSAPNFYSYTAAGSQHCILPRPEFYTIEINGLRFRNWAAAYASGGEIATRISP
jgi:hypothetical protein